MAFVLMKDSCGGRCFHKLLIRATLVALFIPELRNGTGQDHPRIRLLHLITLTLVLFVVNRHVYIRRMDFDLPPSVPVSGIPWDRVLPPLFPRVKGTIGPYAWTPTELLIPVTEHTGAAQVTCDRNGFTVQVDVKHFSPEELLVKVIGDYVVVEGKHEQRKDGSGLVTRQFNRRYRIPSGVDILALESAMSPEGMLIISAPLHQITPDC